MMVILLSSSSDSSRGIDHHLAFGKLLSSGILPLFGAKFRYLDIHFVGKDKPLDIKEDTPAGKALLYWWNNIFALPIGTENSSSLPKNW